MTSRVFAHGAGRLTELDRTWAPPVVILGAGHGRRMGGPKIFTRHGGRTFLERVLSRCAQSGSHVILTVDAGFAQEVDALLAQLPFPRPTTVTCDGSLPMLASVQAALKTLPGGEGFWLWPVDAPFISQGGWALAIKTARSDQDAIWKLRVDGKTGHPIWLPPWSVAEIEAGPWKDGLLGFLAKFTGQIRILNLDGEVIADFNTPQGLAGVPSDG